MLYLGADWWGSDARAMAVAFRRLGTGLIEVNCEDFLPLHWSTFPLRVLRRLARPLFARNYNQAVAVHAGNEAIDFVLVFKGMLLRPSTLEQFKQRGVPIYCFYPDVSFFDHGPEIWECLPYYDCIFTTKSFHTTDERLRERVKDLRLVSHGFDPEVHRPIVLSDRARAHYGCDVSFVGCWSPKKEKLLAIVLAGCPKARVQIWGPGWERAGDETRRCWQGRGAYGDELAIIYRASKINLGLLSEAGGGTNVGDCVTARTWQIPAAGGFMLHEETPELRDFFQPEKESGIFQGASDLPERINYYLANDEKRLRMCDAGLRRCCESDYTYTPAVKAILEVYRKCSARQSPNTRRCD